MVALIVASWGSETEPFQIKDRPPIGQNPDRDSLSDYTAGHLGFHGWMRMVNARIRTRAIIGAMDLPDRRWRDLYDEQVDPVEAADEALAEEGCGR